MQIFEYACVYIYLLGIICMKFNICPPTIYLSYQFLHNKPFQYLVA